MAVNANGPGAGDGASGSATGSPGGGQPGVMTVSALATALTGALSRAFPDRVRVLGEISTFTDRTHWYFDLKDVGAVVNCVMFASAARKSVWRPEVGQEIVASGRVEYYAKGGRVSLVVDRVEPVGEGALDLAFRKLCDELRGLGWFAPERKRPLPTFPRRVAVITSRTGAALQDVLVTMRRRCPAVGVLVVDVRVQGDGAAAEIAQAIAGVSRWRARLGLDAVLVTRGGGSKEDLWAFNERAVAEAIVRCELPVAAAIGHETDTTIAELVADERCATPTQAAMRLTPEMPAMLRQLDSMQARLRTHVERCLRERANHLRWVWAKQPFREPARLVSRHVEQLAEAADRLHDASSERVSEWERRLSTLETRLVAARPEAQQRRARERLDSLSRRLAWAMQRRGADRVSRLDATARHLEAVSPRRVLDRGFSVTLRADGRIVRNAAEVRAGEIIRSMLASGEVRSRVEGGQGDPRSEPPRPEVEPKRRPARREGDDTGPGLFGK